MRACVQFPLQLRNPMWCRPLGGPIHSASLCIHMYSRPVVKDLFFLGVLHPFYLLQSFCLLLRGVPWALRGGITGQILLECSEVFHCLHVVWLCVCVYVSSSRGRKRLQWWLAKVLIYRDSRMSLLIILLLSSFSRTIVFDFPLDAGLSSFMFLATWAVSGLGSILWSGPQIQSDILAIPTTSLPLSHQYIRKAGHHSRLGALNLG